MNNESGLITGPNTMARCFWCGDKADYIAYHDEEWGMPQDDDRRLFEKICLEGFQSGLSWLTILRKRENFRAAFDDFDFTKVARYGDAQVDQLVHDAGIVRHRGKITSTINNAKRALDMVEQEGSLGAWFWQFAEPAARERLHTIDRQTHLKLAQTATSTALSKALKQRGWTFVGPTTCYAFMQAMGLVNDHVDGCAFKSRTQAAQDAFIKPA